MELLQTRVDANGLMEVMDLAPPTSDARGTCAVGDVSTKAFAGQALMLLLIALLVAHEKKHLSDNGLGHRTPRMRRR